MKLFTFLLGAIITLQPAYGQKGPRLVAEEDESEGMAMLEQL